MVCMGFEPGPQDARRRWNHGAMAAALGRPRFKYHITYLPMDSGCCIVGIVVTSNTKVRGSNRYWHF